MIDIKIPIGLMFSLLGVLLTIFGLFTMSDTEMYRKAFDININIWSGILLLLFGSFMLWSSKFWKKAIEKK